MTLELTEDERHLLQMALYEYVHCSGRDQPDEYMKKRYPKEEGYTNEFLKSKNEDVRKRVCLALQLREKLSN